MIRIDDLISEITSADLSQRPSIVSEVSGSYIKVKGPMVKLGDIYECRSTSTSYEVVKGDINGNILMPLEGEVKTKVGYKLYEISEEVELPRNIDMLKGSVLGSDGRPLNMLDFPDKKSYPNEVKRINPMKRKRIEREITTGIKAIDGLLTLGRGQRVGLFAGSGVGKSTLLGMIAKRVEEDLNVIALIGERGREVREFIEKELGQEGLERSIVVVSTSDESPLQQMKAANLAILIAERFRDKGKNVLFMMDSITRFLTAQRSIDMSNGEIPVMGGRTTSMEPVAQKFLERAGTNEIGSITGIYTVLVEAEDFDGPIPDIVRGILDGHIVLKRELAERNHYPAIDVLTSISRVMQDISSEKKLSLSKEIKKNMSIYKENEDAISLGLVVKGQNKEIDRAIELNEVIKDFLVQGSTEDVNTVNIEVMMKRLLE